MKTLSRRFLLLTVFLVVAGCQPTDRPGPLAAVGAAQPALSAASSVAPTATSSPTTTPTPEALAFNASPSPSPDVKVLSEETTVEGGLGEPTVQSDQSPYPLQTSPVIPPDPYPVDVEKPPEPAVWRYRVIHEYPHDPLAYTQGLVIEPDLQMLVEGTGRSSSLRRVDLASGAVKQLHTLPDSYFGEGITIFDDKIVQLTWQSQTGFVYDAQSFDLLGEFTYPHEGWGLTHDGSQLIVSDGTPIIRFWDPETFQETKRIEVASADGPVALLNELEYVDGEIWANVWHTDMIARISPADGRVLGWIDLSGLLDPGLVNDSQAVLNGIAYHAPSGRLFVTGKLWPSLFEIEVVESESS